MTPEEKQAAYKLAESLLAEENFNAGLIGGIVATVLGAGVYAAITVAAGYSVSFMAIALGAFVGLAVQYLGRGIGSRFVVVASVLSVIGCLLGNLIAAILLEARAYGASPVDIASSMSVESVIEFFKGDLQFVDLLFWIGAIGAAAYFAKRPLTREEGLAIYTYDNRPAETRYIS